MRQKHPVCPHRIRRINNQFGWVDHRLVRDRHIEALSHPAAALYLFLITVADARGLSYYSDRSLEKRLTMDSNTLNQAREAYDLTRHSVKLGVSSLRDLLDTQILLTEAQINQIDSYHALQVARAHLDFAVGN